MNCPQCPRTFTRLEHMKRHVNSVHAVESAYSCEECGKKFNRIDSRNRHQSSAHKRHDSHVGFLKKGDRVRIRRACQACALARTRCSGPVANSRCQRCEKKQISCVYGANTTHTVARSTSNGGIDDSATGTEDCTVENVTSASALAMGTDGEVPYPAGQQCDSTVSRNIVAVGPLHSAAPDAVCFDTEVNMEYLWTDQTNWLPVADEFDLLSDLASSGIGDPWSRFVERIPDFRAPVIPLPATENVMAESIADGESPTTSNDLAQSRYVHGDGGRLSRQQIPRENQELIPVHETYLRPLFDLGFPEFVETPSNASFRPMRSGIMLDETCYRIIYHNFDALCCREPSFFSKKFTSIRFPPFEYCSSCFLEYQHEFAKNFSLVHRSTWAEQPEQWILVLAAMTVGSGMYDSSEHGQQSRIAFQEFLRRAVRRALENGPEMDPLPFAQACLLLAVTRFTSGPRLGMEATMAEAQAACEMYANQYRPQLSPVEASQAHIQWQLWIASESHARLLWYKWLLQTMIGLFKDDYGSIGLPVQDLVLPASETLWAARTAETWQTAACQSSLKTNKGFRAPLYSLYTRQKVSDHVTNVGKVLLTYCLLGRSAEVARSLHPLYSVSPAPAGDSSSSDGEYDQVGSHRASQQRLNQHEQHQQWLPANPEFAAFRNSCCDCLDSIHWAANGDIAASKGFEQPLILHLHLARLILLCPYRSLIRWAEMIGSRPYGTSGLIVAEQLDSEVLKWLTLDDHKGRLSLVHAGAMFWHCRRYSAGMFYEPFAIFISALIIVSYGIFLPQVHGALLKIKESTAKSRRGRNDSELRASNEEDGMTPRAILLDRPCDDEIIQIFVRDGYDKMQVEMSRAGDICLPNGQRIVLDETIKLLRSAKYAHYEDGRQYVDALRKLQQRILYDNEM